MQRDERTESLSMPGNLSEQAAVLILYVWF